MSISNRGANLPGITAGADLTGSQHLFVTIDANGQAVVAGAGARVDGALENNPPQDTACSIMGQGSYAKIKAGAAIAAGDDVASDAAGKAITATTGARIAGTCIIGAPVVDGLATILIRQDGVSP